MIRNARGNMLIGNEDPFLFEQFSEMVQNSYSFRRDMMNGNSPYKKKDLNLECDYPDTATLTVKDFKESFDRNPIANRVVGIMADECWKVSPECYEVEDTETETEFERVFNKELPKALRGEQSWYEDPDAGNPIWEYCHRADKLAGIGHFSVVIIGTDDGKPLREPVDGFSDPTDLSAEAALRPVYVNNLAKKRKLLYLTVLDESQIQSIEFEENQYSPRYRKPKFYLLDLGSGDYTNITGGNSQRTTTGEPLKVHWSRVVHVPSDPVESSEVLGPPRQLAVWNDLLDCRKILGADGEAFWRNCMMRLFFETNPELGSDVIVDMDSLRDQVWDMENGLQKWAALIGMKARTVAPTVVDPTAHIKQRVELICVKIGVPIRIFLGSERGEMSSGQDKVEHRGRINGRRLDYCTLRIAVSLIDRFIQIGICPEPKTGTYKLYWKEADTLEPLEKAELANKLVDALVKFISGRGDSLMDPLDFYVRFLEIPQEEAKELLKRALAYIEKISEAQAEALDSDEPVIGPDGKIAVPPAELLAQKQAEEQAELSEGAKDDTTPELTDSTTQVRKPRRSRTNGKRRP